MMIEHHLRGVWFFPAVPGFSFRVRNANRGCRGAPGLQAIWFANHPSAAAKESGCGLAGQSACLVNRRSWAWIPTVPLKMWLCSLGSFFDRRPWQCLCFSNRIPTVQKPKDLVLPTHWACKLIAMDCHKHRIHFCVPLESWHLAFCWSLYCTLLPSGNRKLWTIS